MRIPFDPDYGPYRGHPADPRSEPDEDDFDYPVHQRAARTQCPAAPPKGARMTKRIYRIADGDTVRLVEATNAAQAIRHCASQRYHVKPASAQDVAYLMGKGVKVELAKPVQEELA